MGLVFRKLNDSDLFGSREEAKRDVFNYIEMFYNPKRRHGYANDVSPVLFKNRYFSRLWSVWKSRGDSYFIFGLRWLSKFANLL